jgi:hypothetical protein
VIQPVEDSSVSSSGDRFSQIQRQIQPDHPATQHTSCLLPHFAVLRLQIFVACDLKQVLGCPAHHWRIIPSKPPVRFEIRAGPALCDPTTVPSRLKTPNTNRWRRSRRLSLASRPSSGTLLHLSLHRGRDRPSNNGAMDQYFNNKTT